MHLSKHCGSIALAIALTMAAASVQAEVVAVVAAKSTVTTLSKRQVADIFLGKSTSFPDGSQAIPIDQAESSVVRDEFYATFVGKSAAQIKAHWSKIIFTGRGRAPKTVANSSEIEKAIVANPNAIGYIERSRVTPGIKIVISN